MRSLVQLSNPNLASKCSPKKVFFCRYFCQVVVNSTVTSLNILHNLRKNLLEVIGGTLNFRYAHVTRWVKSLKNYQGQCVYGVISLRWGDICNWLSARAKYSTLWGQKKMQSVWHSTDDKCGHELRVSGTERFTQKHGLDFYGIHTLGMQITSQKAHPLKNTEYTSLKNQIRIKVRHTQRHPFRTE